MDLLYLLIGIIFLGFIAYYYLNQSDNKKPKLNTMVEKYNIKSRRDAWNLINNPQIPKDDREKIAEYYKGMNL